MNCDDAFDRMTLPGAHNHAGLRQHLSRCPRCRAMQETLSPAMAWLSSDSKRDHGRMRDMGLAATFLSEDAVRVAERAAHRLRARPAVLPCRETPRRLVSAGIALAGLVVVALLACALPPFDSSRNPVRPADFTSQGSVCLWKMPADGYSRTPPTADQLIATCAACHLSSQ